MKTRYPKVYEVQFWQDGSWKVWHEHFAYMRRAVSLARTIRDAGMATQVVKRPGVEIIWDSDNLYSKAEYVPRRDRKYECAR